jgi:hypothetical protein
MVNGHGGRREGAGRPKGMHGVKSTDLAEMLDDMGANPAKGLARLALKAEAAGDDDLVVRAFTGLMPFRYPKLKESSLDLGLGLSGSLADRLEAASARLQITVVSGIDRPPDDPGAIESDPVPPPSPVPPPPETPAPQPPPAAVSRPKPRPAAPPPEPLAPSLTLGQPVPAHVYWSQPAQPEPSAPLSDYDPWGQT